MTPRFSAHRFAAGAALAAALVLTGCGDGGNDLNQAAASQNTPLPQIPAPDNGDWTQVVQETEQGGFRMGNPDAPVKLVEYASITCPACAQFSQAAHAELTNNYVKSGQVSWEYRPFMLFPTDPGLFQLLRCQGPQPFFALVEQIYASQAEWSGRLRDLPPAQLDALGAMPPQQQAGAIVRAIGMDQFFRQRGMPQSRVDQCLADPAGLQRLADIQNVGTADNVTGTPAFFINGTQTNASSWQELQPMLRRAIGL